MTPLTKEKVAELWRLFEETALDPSDDNARALMFSMVDNLPAIIDTASELQSQRTRADGLEAELARAKERERRLGDALDECRRALETNTTVMNDAREAVSQLLTRAEAAEKRVAELAAALRPFATLIQKWEDDGDTPPIPWERGYCEMNVNLADLRRARSLVEEVTNG